jgi:nitrite reductase/ring-hydroxylating ferredoxin subunit
MSRAEEMRFVCERSALTDGGLAVTFSIQRASRIVPAFAIAHRGQVHAYENVCPHRGTSLDWQPGQLFDESGLYLICATHGALFEPDTGRCVAGPCRGASLQSVPVHVEQGRVELTTHHRVLPGES